MSQERFAVIGSNAFSAAHFVAGALDQDAQVVGLSRSPEPDSVFLPYAQHANHGNFTFHQADLNHDLDRIMDVLDAFRPQYVVNFAAQSMVGQSWTHPEHWFQTNAVSTVKFHNLLRTRDYLVKYVHISTPEVYGSTSGLVPEHRNYQPSTPYAVSRAAGDLSLHTFHATHGFPVVFTRAANVYGPGQQLYRIVPRTLLYGHIGQQLQLHGGGHSVRSFIHIRDVVDATLRVARDGAPGEIYHLSTREQISIRDLVAKICERAAFDFDQLTVISEDRPGKDAAYLLDSAKARQELGWSDRIGLDEGLDETARWIAENLDTLRRQPLEYQHKP